ncbi:MAG: HlyD family efflux transporter periplasmic adaptor subunit [Myxococcota bacterium]
MADAAAQAWLALQCQTLAGVRRGLVVRAASAAGPPVVLAAWPKEEHEPAELLGVSRAALSRGGVVARAGEAEDGSGPAWSELAVPFGEASPFGGVVAVRVEHGSAEGNAAVKRAAGRLAAGAPWLEALLRSSERQLRLVGVVETLATALEHEGLAPSSAAVATQLAGDFGCERVSIGLRRRGRMRVEAISNTTRFDVRSEAVRDLEAAMDEAADQDAPVFHPAPEGAPARVALAHEALTRGRGVVWTVPLGSEGRAVGAVTFERAEPGPPPPAVIEHCKGLAALLGPVLELKRQARESVTERWRERAREQFTRLRGPGHGQLKATVAGSAVLLLAVLLVPVDYRIKADATLEGRVQRAMVAGVEGFIAEANVRAGDLLAEGQVMARLDDRDLLIAQREGEGKRAQLVEEHWKALAEHDRAEANLLGAKIDQATAELDLVAAQLARTTLVAPFEGVVVRGDLSQSLGSPVERGELLFEVAPLDGYRIILKVDQSDIAEPAAGQAGRLALTALPGAVLPITVERVTPVSIAEDGRNYFRVEAHLDEPVAGLRPGMEGVAKVEVGSRSLAWIWSHGLVDWLRLRLWAWLP